MVQNIKGNFLMD